MYKNVNEKSAKNLTQHAAFGVYYIPYLRTFYYISYSSMNNTISSCTFTTNGVGLYDIIG